MPTKAETPALLDFPLRFGDRDIKLLFDQAKRMVPMRIEPRALRLALLETMRSPSRLTHLHDRLGDPASEALACRTSGRVRIDYPVAKILTYPRATTASHCFRNR